MDYIFSTLGKQDLRWHFILQVLSILFSQASSLTSNSYALIHPCWVACELQDPLLYPSSVLGLQLCTIVPGWDLIQILMLVVRQAFYGNFTKTNLQIQSNAHQNPSKIFHRPWKNNTQLHMEKQKIQDSKKKSCTIKELLEIPPSLTSNSTIAPLCKLRLLFCFLATQTGIITQKLYLQHCWANRLGVSLASSYILN